jgi:hypothetical protein
MRYNEFVNLYQENTSGFKEFEKADLMSEYIVSEGFKIEIEFVNIPAGKIMGLPSMKITAIKGNEKISTEDIFLKDALKDIIDQIEK